MSRAKRKLDPGTVEGLFMQAVGSGATVHGVGHAEWDISERCECPVYRDVHTSTYRRRDFDGTGPMRAVWVQLWTRCRRCPACLKMRRKLWTARACHELRQSSRSWLITLTLRPEEQYKALLRSKRRHGADPTDEFVGRHEEISKEITRYLKRVRAEEGSFRYIVVCEAHKSGLPHYHALVHETGTAIRWSSLTDQWKLGWVEAVLVKDGDLYKEVYHEHGQRLWKWTAEPGAAGKVARYVAKYLAKSVLARVRASQLYGGGRQTSWEAPPVDLQS